MMDEREQAEVLHNKAVRGYIIRSLVKGYNNSALTRQISNAMIAAGVSDYIPGYHQPSELSGRRRIYRVYRSEGDGI